MQTLAEQYAMRMNRYEEEKTRAGIAAARYPYNGNGSRFPTPPAVGDLLRGAYVAAEGLYVFRDGSAARDCRGDAFVFAPYMHYTTVPADLVTTV